MDTTITPESALYAALARAQAKFKAIRKNREVTITMKSGGKFKFRYADIDEINVATREALTSEGLSLVQPVRGDSSNGAHRIETILMHGSGGTLTSSIDIKPPAAYADPKEFGATVTYLRRYALSALLGLAADDDLDENGQPTTGQGAEPDDATVKRVNALTESLVKEVKGQKTEDDALAVWRRGSKELADFPNAYGELKTAYTSHIRAMRASTQAQGAKQ